MARRATNSGRCQLGTIRRSLIDLSSVRLAMEECDTFKPTGTSVGGWISQACCPVPWYTPVMANATYKTNMTYRPLTLWLIPQSSNDSSSLPKQRPRSRHPIRMLSGCTDGSTSAEQQRSSSRPGRAYRQRALQGHGRPVRWPSCWFCFCDSHVSRNTY